jgi:hypothetical protein
MLSNRTLPRIEEPKSTASTKDEGEEADPRAAPMSLLSKRATPQVEGKSVTPLSPQTRVSQTKTPPSMNCKGSPQTPSPTSGTKGFFPATSPGVQERSKLDKDKRTARGERYETKTSSTARISDATSANPESSPVAPGTKQDILALNQSQHHRIALPVVPDLGECENDPMINLPLNGQLNLQSTSPEADTNTEATGKMDQVCIT